MQHKTFFVSLLLMLPTLFMGQVLQEINTEHSGLPDPDKYPFEVYLKLGLPVGSITSITGYQNMHQVFMDGGLEVPQYRLMSILEVGARYKRFYLEIGGASKFANSPLSSFSNDRFSINSSYNLGYVDLGYSVWEDRNSALLVRLGIGQIGSSYDIRLLQNSSPVDFDDLLNGGAGNSSSLIYHENIFWDISAELWGGRAKSQTSFGEALRIGYRRGINETAWEALDNTSLNAPLDRMGEFYINVSFHLGKSFSQKSK